MSAVPRVVAFGGGHGLAASLRALRRCAAELELDITAVVTVGDDGGSSGRLRAERVACPGRPAPGAGRVGRRATRSRGRTAALFQHRFAASTAAARWAGTTAPAA